MSITYRPAKAADAEKLAEISILAGGGTFELLLQDMKRGVSVKQVMTALCAAPNTEYSYKNYLVAEMNGTVVGGINYISVGDRYKLAPNINPILQAKFRFGWWQLIKFFLRARHLKGMNVIKAPKNSMHINDVAVFPEYQGYGIGKQLVLQVIEIAKQRAFGYVSLYVWEDNTSAIGFYEKLGFITAGKATVVPHGRYLPHSQSRLMLYNLQGPISP